ncbi:hypothetical protein MWMV18_MWMV18_03585 [Acinetobacter calcoaceticus]|nr:hypothetical protein MWMV18_MWMV18_03585 [Acinetobacter calcoaceticus]
MTIEKKINEREIAKAAAYILRESFIKAERTGKVLYVENDIIWSKAPNEQPIFIKKLYRQNPSQYKEITNRKKFKIKKKKCIK